MNNREASVDIALVFREVEPCTGTQASDQRVIVFLGEAGAVRCREIVTNDAAVDHFRLRFNKGELGKIELVSYFSSDSVGIVVVGTCHRLSGKVSVEPSITCRQIQVGSIFMLPHAVSRKSVGFVVAGNAGRFN